MNFRPTAGDSLRIVPAKKGDSLNFARVEVYATQEDPYNNQSRHLKNQNMVDFTNERQINVFEGWMAKGMLV